MESKSASPSAWHHFLRATGLRVFEALFSELFGQVEWLDYEPPKPIFYNSWGSVFARLGVHILPILASVTIISLNLCTLYLGSGGLPGPLIDFSITSAMLQVVAKLQELLIVASLTSVVFSVIRDQLVSTMGVPLGLLSVGFMFSHLSFFWSMEFWGALRSQLPLSTKILTALLLAAAGIISATAGPSVAVLLVPRYHDWDAGGSDFFLRGTVDQIFPDRLTNITTSPSRDEILTSLCLSPNATNSALCPSAGFRSLMSHVASLPKLENGFDKGPTPRVIHGPFGWYSVTVDSNLAAVPLSLLVGNPHRPLYKIVGNPRGAACQASVIAPYLPAMMYQTALKEDWNSVIGNTFWESGNAESWGRTQYNWHKSSTLKTLSQIPIVRTGCSLAQNISAEGTNISFPIMPEHSCWNETASLNVSQLDNEPSDRLRVTWTQLPREFGSTSTGMIFEAPWVDNGTSRVVVGCSIDARWAKGRVDAQQGHVSETETLRYRELKGELQTPFRPPTDGSWRPITFDASWLRLLTPPQRDRPTGLDSNAFQSILENSDILDQHLNNADNPTETWNDDKDGSLNRTLYLEWITALVIASGISRHGIDGALNMTGDVRSWTLLDYSKRPDFNKRLVAGKTALQQPNGTEFTSFFTSISINGLAYKANSITDYLAITVLLAHIVLVLGHSVYVVYTRRSSDAWDSVMEMLILAHNSQPTSYALRNTSAGIWSPETFKKMAVVRVTRPEDADAEVPMQSDGRVELVVLEDEEILGSGDQQVSILPDQTAPISTSTTAISLLPQKGQAGSKDSSIRSRKLRDPAEFQKVQPNLAYS